MSRKETVKFSVWVSKRNSFFFKLKSYSIRREIMEVVTWELGDKASATHLIGNLNGWFVYLLSCDDEI